MWMVVAMAVLKVMVRVELNYSGGRRGCEDGGEDISKGGGKVE